MHIFLNALGASCASGITYLRNVLPHLSAHSGLQTTVAVNQKLRGELPESSNVAFCDLAVPPGAARRFWFEQTTLRGYIRRSGADVLISAGNFALRNSPVPQILLSGNSLYTSADFSKDLHTRREYRLLLDHWVKRFFARRSVRWADSTVAPSHTFGNQLQCWTGKQIVCIHHGFDRAMFSGDHSSLPSHIQQKLDSAHDALRLLFVSHYNYYRNFETLVRAIPILRTRLGKKIRLFLACNLRDQDNPGSYRAETCAALVRKLGVREEVVQLGPVPYSLLHHVYKACDIYVTPAYAESFAHPLVEAMACGLPVIASDLPVHREICGPAALYFHRFSPEGLSAQVIQLAESSGLRKELSRHARTCSGDFSWARHVDELTALASRLLRAHETSCDSRVLPGACCRDVEAIRKIG